MPPLSTRPRPLAHVASLQPDAFGTRPGSGWNGAPRGMAAPRFPYGLAALPDVAAQQAAGRNVVQDAVDIYNDFASGDPAGAGGKAAGLAVEELVESVTFFTEADLWPPITRTARELIRESGKVDPNAPPVVGTVKPTLIVRFKQGLGTRVIAPGGRGDPTAWERNRAKAVAGTTLAVGGLLTLGVLGGWWLRGRRSAS